MGKLDFGPQLGVPACAGSQWRRRRHPGRGADLDMHRLRRRLPWPLEIVNLTIGSKVWRRNRDEDRCRTRDLWV